MQRRRTQSERRQDTRAQLLQAGAVVFARRGYHAASVTEIVKQAGYSTGALYVHFAGKHELFVGLFDAALTDWAAGYAAAVADTRSVDEAITAAGRRWSGLQDQHPTQTLLFIEFWCAAMRNNDIRLEFADRHGAIKAAISALVKAMRERFDVTPTLPDDALGAIITALADGLALQRLTDATTASDELFAAALRTILGIDPHGPATQAKGTSS